MKLLLTISLFFSLSGYAEEIIIATGQTCFKDESLAEDDSQQAIKIENIGSAKEVQDILTSLKNFLPNTSCQKFNNELSDRLSHQCQGRVIHGIETDSGKFSINIFAVECTKVAVCQVSLQEKELFTSRQYRNPENATMEALPLPAHCVL